ncbi:hypothetical protein VST7929_02339 [Vibrio stylophorae]|uniref:Sodium:proton antiporter n=1 Tax=Vibrio stylophorae TaxID=659351 RepID=A0ABM8ZVR1_9VIBR|nr:Na+/H+ antiporter NhaC family protein [Vibrio stylophorae]CAH0534408.1 hypothetical protein VST7929_02339 [Vibrio stylophorae]
MTVAVEASLKEASSVKSFQKIAIGVVVLLCALVVFQPGIFPINSVILAISLMIVMCLLRVPVPIALIGGALVGAINSGLSVSQALEAYNSNLGAGAQVGMTYVMIGAFAVALARSGILDLFANKVTMAVSCGVSARGLKWGLYAIFVIVSVISQNLVPVHIAFIPVMIPPLLATFNRLGIDRRAIACVIACSISISYLLLPTGFGAIYLFEILLPNLNEAGAGFNLNIVAKQVPHAMFLPVMGIVAGMLFAVFISYRRPRRYQSSSKSELLVDAAKDVAPSPIALSQLLFVVAAVVVALCCQLWFDSLLLGAMLGFVILSFSGVFTWQQQDDVFTEGMRMMVQIAIIITLAAGFSGVLNATNEIPALIETSKAMIGDNQMFAALMMLLVGLFITIGFGDSFASVPILAPIYVPLALSLGFSPMATVALLGASAALGDAGSPASTISLGVTSGLNADGQHDHLHDSVIPTFLHANVGMVLFAWLAALIL